MSENISYSSDKVKNFIQNLNTYKRSKQEYIDSLNIYQTNINGLTTSHQNSKDKDFTSNNNNYLTSEGVIIDSKEYNANKINKMDESGNFVSNLSFDPKNEENIDLMKSNTFVQMGLNDLNYVNNVNTKNVYKFSNHEPSFTFQNECNIDNVFQCDSYAKMTNKDFYGISETNNNCKCYTFTENEKNNDLTEYKDHIVDKNTNEMLDNINISYLGIMFDGGLYGLKKENYKDNFDKLYVKNNNTFIIESRDQERIPPLHNKCNPFTGNGVTDISFNDLGILYCEMK